MLLPETTHCISGCHEIYKGDHGARQVITGDLVPEGPASVQDLVDFCNQHSIGLAEAEVDGLWGEAVGMEWTVDHDW